MASDGLTDKQNRFVAAFIGPARGNATEAARIAGYRGNRKTLQNVGSENLSNPMIAAAIDADRQRVRNEGVASLEYRLSRLDELEQRYWRLLEERAEEYDGEAAGGGTGLIVRQYKQIGQGPSAETVTEYVADTAVTKELRALYDDAAKEVGHRVHKSEVSADDSFIAALREFGQGTPDAAGNRDA